MLAPILPSPIIPSCILFFFLVLISCSLRGACRFENVDTRTALPGTSRDGRKAAL